MSISYDDLNEVRSFDVIFIGHLASVTANMFAMLTKNIYKSLVLSKISHLLDRNIKVHNLVFITTNQHR